MRERDEWMESATTCRARADGLHSPRRETEGLEATRETVVLAAKVLAALGGGRRSVALLVQAADPVSTADLVLVAGALHVALLGDLCAETIGQRVAT